MSRLNHNKRHPLLQIVMSKKSNWQKLTNTGKNNFYWTFLLPGSFSRLWVTKVLNSRRWLSQKSDSLFTSQQIKGKSYNTIIVLSKWKKSTMWGRARFSLKNSNICWFFNVALAAHAKNHSNVSSYTFLRF